MARRKVIVNISVILAHPNKESLNHAIASTAVEQLRTNGHSVSFHDLYREGFDPVLLADEIPKDGRVPDGIRKYCDEIAAAEGVVIVHPNWWGQPPAILAGWIDRVMRPGVAYEFLEDDGGEGVPRGLLKLKAVLVFNTSNTPADREKEVFGDPLEAIWKDCIFGLCGDAEFYRRMFSVVVTSSDVQRREWLKDVRQAVSKFFPPQ